MTTTSTPADRLRELLLGPPRSVLELADGLLDLARRGELRFDYRGEQVHAQLLEGGNETTLVAPLRRSIFRTFLARVAALCNEFAPDSVSPYGGDGQLAVPGDESGVRTVSFQNTPAEQWLTVSGPVAVVDGLAQPAGCDTRAAHELDPVPRLN